MHAEMMEDDMDHRYSGNICPVCEDPWCAGCEESLAEEREYSSGPASLFAALARGEKCCCLEVMGDNPVCPLRGKLFEERDQETT